MDKQELIGLITKRGWSIFPMTLDKKSGDKVPLIKGGFKSATLNKSKISEWIKKWPDCLIGIPCEPNLFFAVDVDPDGLDIWKKWVEEYGEPVVGPRQRTPRGGFHLLFKLPIGLKVPNVAGKIGAGIDLRSNGSICTNTTGYEWDDKNGHGLDAPLTNAPEWILDKIREYNEAKERRWESFVPGNYEEMDPEGAGQYWLDKALSEAHLGNRHDTGFRLACQLRDSRVSKGQADTIMRIYAERVPKHDEPFPVSDALNSLRDAYSSPPREPAHLKLRSNKVIPAPAADHPVGQPSGQPVGQGIGRSGVQPGRSGDRSANQQVPMSMPTRIQGCEEADPSEVFDIPLGFVLRSDQVAKLDSIAREQGISRHELIRKVMVQFLVDKGK